VFKREAFAMLILLLLPIILALGLAFFAPMIWSHHGRVTVVDGSEAGVVDGEVEICGQRFEFGSLHPGESRTFIYNVTCEGDYLVTAQFAAGQRLKQRIGYVTSERDFSHELILKPDHVVWGSNRVGYRLS
jgi:hypothetical protein